MNNKVTLTATVQEMHVGSDSKLSDVPLSSQVDYEKLVEGDKDPMFVTVEVMNPTVSKNGRNWKEEHLYSIAEQINTKLPEGYRGHLKDEDRATQAPEPHTIWVGAKVVEIDGVKRLLAKGYVLSDSMRNYLKRAVGLGKKVAVSVYGSALQSYDKVSKLYTVKEFDLESIDWTRIGSEGLTPSFVPVIAREQDATMDKKLSEVTLEDIQTHRPELIEELKAQLDKPADPTPEPTPTPTPEPAKEETAKVEEMVTILGLSDGKEIISEMKARNEEREILLDSYLDSKVRETVTKPSMRGIFKKMVIGEMTGRSKTAIDMALNNVLESNEGKTFISEMAQVRGKVNPIEDNHAPVKDVRKFTKIS